MNELYKRPDIKTNQQAAEKLAGELLGKAKIDELYAINKITRNKDKKSYDMKHTGEPESTAKTKTEKLLAIDMFRKEYEHIGKVLDYEIPLKNSNKTDTGVGRIDLFAKNGNTITLLELKGANSKETLLRCALEIFTYWKILDHQKFLHDYELPQDSVVKKAVLVVKDGAAHTQYKQENKNTVELMKRLDVGLYVYDNPDSLNIEKLL